MKAVKLKDGQIGTVVREWNWKENPQMKIYKDRSYSERLHDDFVDIELNGQLKTHKLHFGSNPVDSNFHHVYMTVCKKDVEFIEVKL
jgi:hypothetical protein